MRNVRKICSFLCCIAFFFSAEGQVTTFQKTYDATTNNEYGYAVQQCADGGYVVAGITDFLTTSLYGDAYILRTDEYGSILWSKSYGGDSTDVVVSIQQCTDGSFIAVGNTRSYGQGDYDVYLIKTDENGDTLWIRTYGGTEDDGGDDNDVAELNFKDVEMIAEQYKFGSYPNPFGESAIITAFVPKGTINSAEVVVTDVLGKEVIRYQLQEGNNAIELLSRDLEYGVLFYSLWLDGEWIATGKMLHIK